MKVGVGGKAFGTSESDVRILCRPRLQTGKRGFNRLRVSFQNLSQHSKKVEFHRKVWISGFFFFN